ncbi:methionine--tRNA ligase [Ruminiclostridium hungatei]|uniref:Methionine--tRNA ligase n=1 Tax=Ruminiclostridium hungatei TaxID=48256 RepID=A0A1V4SHH8_RUMHU|nr:methionine--tRNA ligase [Ruminiclostridium hungatei]OPX42956.1 methionine--tRNA ligase [Ruminiclostridium hungatei]
MNNEECRNILIGGAWPYANGSLHIGRVSALIPGDILARYHRAKGDRVFYVSGSDCHGTPVAIRARQEQKTPREISDFYHQEFQECFRRLGFTFDSYDRTSSEEHREFVQDFHSTMYEGKYIYEKSAPQAFCTVCNCFLADRFVEGKCPECGQAARGDQCDSCGKVLEPELLVAPHCSVCTATPEFRETRHLYLALSELSGELEAYIGRHPDWRKNALAFSKKYINEGLRDRAVTRDLDWGIEVPKSGYDNKKIYIWAENVLGYLSGSLQVAESRGDDFKELWFGENSKHYYVHGKDNIPFHSIILPGLLLANGAGWRLPDEIISCEYLTLEGRKLSTSKKHAVWVKDMLDSFHADSIRYFLITNGPEKRDTDFTWREYVNSHNGELLGAYGNFANRNLAFVAKYFEGLIPGGGIDCEISEKLGELYEDTGRRIENGAFKEALDVLFDFVRWSNKYFDTHKPWETRTTAPEECRNTIFNCLQIIANLSVLLKPFIPFSSEKLQSWLGLKDCWRRQFVPAGYCLPETGILFERIDKKRVEEEVRRLSQA